MGGVDFKQRRHEVAFCDIAGADLTGSARPKTARDIAGRLAADTGFRIPASLPARRVAVG